MSQLLAFEAELPFGGDACIGRMALPPEREQFLPDRGLAILFNKLELHQFYCVACRSKVDAPDAVAKSNLRGLNVEIGSAECPSCGNKIRKFQHDVSCNSH
ncbi:hypothetical protein [Jannaschia sp. CCS1]|uniref:hypothetical protein n=1 Tax=Jannaschia sp. (strain CCS1) TaxID=290400 RepID=UPI00140FEC0B|nr:hypothetical protein [Jannaschia sp. CCS1]